MKEKREQLGFQFWASLAAVSVTLSVGGVACTVYSALRFIAGSSGYAWLLSVLFGILMIICGGFCFRLLPKWAKTVRKDRLMEERLKGALGATSVSQYIQADEERGRNLMDSISQKQEEVGRNLARRMDSRMDSTTILIRKSNEMMEALRASLADVNRRLNTMADPAELEKYRRETLRLEAENRALREVPRPETPEKKKEIPKTEPAEPKKPEEMFEDRFDRTEPPAPEPETTETETPVEEREPEPPETEKTEGKTPEDDGTKIESLSKEYENAVDFESDMPNGYLSEEDEQKWNKPEEDDPYSSDGDETTYW